MNCQIFLVALLMLSTTVSFGAPEDKETLREACLLVKEKVRRTQCFDALDRLSQPAKSTIESTTAPIAVPKPKPMTLSIRGLECENHEFSELNSLTADETISLYCSFEQGAYDATASARQARDRGGDPGTAAALIRSNIARAQRCMNAQGRVMDLLRRKFSSELSAMDCKRVVGYTGEKP